MRNSPVAGIAPSGCAGDAAGATPGSSAVPEYRSGAWAASGGADASISPRADVATVLEMVSSSAAGAGASEPEIAVSPHAWATRARIRSRLFSCGATSVLVIRNLPWRASSSRFSISCARFWISRSPSMRAAPFRLCASRKTSSSMAVDCGVRSRPISPDSIFWACSRLSARNISRRVGSSISAATRRQNFAVITESARRQRPVPIVG